MNAREETHSDYRFLTGFALGGVVGAGLALWLVPRAAAEIKARAADTAKSVGAAVSGRYREARTSVTGAMDGLIRKGQAVRDDACDTVIRAAQDVEEGARKVQRLVSDSNSKVG